jgi:hypothetical protein
MKECVHIAVAIDIFDMGAIMDFAGFAWREYNRRDINLGGIKNFGCKNRNRNISLGPQIQVV